MSALAGLVRSFPALLDPADGNAALPRTWMTSAEAKDLSHLHAFTCGLDATHPTSTILTVTRSVHHPELGESSREKAQRPQARALVGYRRLRSLPPVYAPVPPRKIARITNPIAPPIISAIRHAARINAKNSATSEILITYTATLQVRGFGNSRTSSPSKGSTASQVGRSRFHAALCRCRGLRSHNWPSIAEPKATETPELPVLLVRALDGAARLPAPPPLEACGDCGEPHTGEPQRQDGIW
jgi:hypothetical protein